MLGLLRRTLLIFLLTPSFLMAQDFENLVTLLPEGDFDDRGRVVNQIAVSGDDRALPLLEMLTNGELSYLRETGRIVTLREEGDDDVAYDALSDERIGVVGRRDARDIRVNNGLRRDIAAAIGRMGLQSPDPAVRLDAAQRAFRARDPAQIAALTEALSAESEPHVATVFEQARAAAILQSDDATQADKRAAIAVLAARGDRDALSALSPALSDPALVADAQAATDEIERSIASWGLAQNLWYGISLGSVLMLAAIGLAITFGVMGVINMAHGELVMIGAYTTYLVQETIRNSFPEMFGWSLAIAVPLAFLTAGAVGVAIERGVVRYLYGRPLETLLATWGISLILQQAVRSIFGPNNREVGNPDWMSGAVDVGQMAMTWNRIWILVFALAVFAALLLVLNRTPIGLQMRAVTQNRSMAANMGIRTGWVDAMTFGLGAGVAGLAGVALSQIDNVSPNLGQSYIVDSFMVVVFGGAGNLWGAFAGAFTLGIATKFMEPWVGAVLAKILILVAIILFIQKRPRGLFALKGRAVDS